MARTAKTRRKARVNLNMGAIQCLLRVSPITPNHAAKKAGIDSSHLYRILSGKKTTMYYETILKLAEAYEVDPEWLIDSFKAWDDDRVGADDLDVLLSN